MTPHPGRVVYPLTIFLGAFLLFGVQPLIGKYVLPWYGGGPGVWTACMLFFQVFLLIGYAYAHGISSWLSPRRQAAVHLGVLALSLAFASIAPGPDWRPSGDDPPTLHILALLSAHVGVPFATLAATGPLLTRWFDRIWPDREPYRLYALSNAGSLLALLSYPFVVEPGLRLDSQARVWSIGYLGFALLCGVSASTFRQRGLAARPSTPQRESDLPSERGEDPALWLALAATGSALLLATTNQICQDLAVIPLLWVLPLSIYLLSFIVCFDRERWYQRGIFLPLLALSAGGVTWIIQHDDTGWFQISIFAVALFAGTMVCHGELVRAKPPPRRLTAFYLAIAAGGALGGAFVSLLAPRLFPGYWEYPLALIATGLLAAICVRGRPSRATRGRRLTAIWIGVAISVSVIAGGWTWRELNLLSGALETTRTFFGVTRVTQEESRAGAVRVMWHGRIAHGSQFQQPAQRRQPTSYFGRDSGVGIALERYRALRRDPEAPLRVGVVGMGAGTLAAYGRPGDVFRFYEIDPEVERVAREYFSYLDESPATVDVVLGDGRLSLEREAARNEPRFDLLILDAFLGDAVPVHLLTREAYQTYLARLRPGGVLVFQVTNRYLDLASVARGLAMEAGQQAVRIVSTEDPLRATRGAHYVIVTDNRALLGDREVQLATSDWTADEPGPQVWTDDSANLWSVISRRVPIYRWESAPNLGHFVVDRADLLSIEDEARIATLCRALYADSGGASAMAVVTTQAMEAGATGEALFENFVANLFQKLGLGRAEIDRGLLVFISRDDRRAGVHVGDSWPPELRERVQLTFVNTAIAGLSKGEASRGILQFAEAIDYLIRNDDLGARR